MENLSIVDNLALTKKSTIEGFQCTIDEFDISTLVFRIVEEDESTDPAFVAPDSGRATGEGGAVEVSDVSTLTDDDEGQDLNAVFLKYIRLVKGQ